MKPHKHADVIKAWADGARVQRSLGNDEWVPCPHPKWDEVYLYRVEPPRVFPKTSLTGEQLRAAYHSIGDEVGTETSWTRSCQAVADAAIKQYILDEEHRSGARE